MVDSLSRFEPEPDFSSPEMSVHDVAATCPHPLCARELPAGAGLHVCAAGHAAGRCASCGASHRLSARFCRRCRLPLQAAPELPSLRETPEPERYQLTGTFRRPPVLWAGAMVGIAASGRVECLPLLAGARQVCLAELPAEAGASRGALVRVQALGRALPRAGGAAVLLAVHPGGVEAVVLATGDVLPLYRADGELMVNPAENATGFTAVAASDTHFAVAVRAGPERAALLLGSLTQEAAPERAVELAGRHAVGPVFAGGLFALATGRGAAVVDPRTGDAAVLDWPRGFEPMLAREAGGPQVAAGTVPLTTGRADGEPWVTVLGRQGGLPGILRLGRGGASGFEPLGRGSSVTGNPDGSLCIAADDEVRVAGAAEALPRRRRLQFGMPAAVAGGLFCSFAEEGHRGLHRLRLEPETGQGEAAEWIWEDAECHERSCAAPLVGDGLVVVPYLIAEGAGNPGLRCIVWKGQERTAAR